MNEYYAKQLEQALRRVEYDVQLLHERESDWEEDATDGMHIFRGFMDPFLVEKHIVDLLREVWHLGDGARETINEKWKAGQIQVNETNLDGGSGPGRVIVKKHLESCRWIQLCADLANLTKHYRLTHPPKSGSAPPRLAETVLTAQITGKLDFSTKPDGVREIKLENPAPMRPTMLVLDESGKSIGDAVEIALAARDSWLGMLRGCGIMLDEKPPH